MVAFLGHFECERVCVCAYLLARLGVRVRLYERKGIKLDVMRLYFSLFFPSSLALFLKHRRKKKHLI